MQALILAAGKGTRMKSARAKVLHPLLGLPLLEHVRRAVAAAGADPVTVVVGHQAGEVEAAFAGGGIGFVRQEPQHGTGHAVQCARAAVGAHPGRPLLVVAGDVPLLEAATLRQLCAAHLEQGAAATVLTMTLDQPGAYGRVLRDPDGRVQGIVEARDATPEVRAVREVNTGIYMFAVEPLLAVLDLLRPDNAQGEYYLTDAIALLVRRGAAVHALAAGTAEETLGVNSQQELAQAARRLRDRRNQALQAAGVRLEDPETITVSLDAEVEADATLRPFTMIEGRSRIAREAVVGPFARVVDSTVGEGALVLDHCLLVEALVEAGASVGPFAHLRPASRVGRKAKVGNFVELKKTHLGDGSKAPHLSYLGDATIGPGVNVGAGTITCNYDGVHKHPTRIEAGAFIGSDTTLVAPVTVGEGAYVGAGSAITEDVPPYALALGRARQVVKLDWARHRGKKSASPAGNEGQGGSGGPGKA